MNRLITLLLASVVGGIALVHAQYLGQTYMPHGENYLPAPPQYNSDVRYFNDWLYYGIGKSIRDTERGAQATADASTSINYFCQIYSVPFGMTISSSNTPKLYALLSNARSDGNSAANTVKKYYMKTRPFMRFEEHTAYPASEDGLRTNGSYPSGHTAQGWTLALILAEINIDRQEEILARGYEYGESRDIGGFHWKSDVDAGRCVASAAVARLHANATFMQALNEAKAEFNKKWNGTKAYVPTNIEDVPFDYNTLPTGEENEK